MSRASPLDSQQTRRPGIDQRSHTMPRPTIAPLKIPAENTRRSTNRWSEIVPPHTALTFFAVYDPSEGLVGFSGSSLLPVDSSYGQLRTPGIPHDGQSEVFAIDRLGPGTSALSTAAMTSNTAMSDMQAMMDAYFRGDRWQVDREALFATDATPRVSSTLEGLNGIHVEPSSSDTLLGSMEKTLSGDLDGRSTCSDDFIPCHSRSNTLDSPCDLDSGYGSAGEDTIHARAPYTREINDSFYVYDDYSCDRLNEHSAFSVTTTSTSSYIDVNTPSTAAFYHPITPTPPNKKYASLAEEVESLNILAYIQARPKTPVSRPRQSPSTPCSSSPSSPSSQFSRKLRKLKSTAALPTPPADVLSRETYNHHWDDGEAKPTSPSKPRLHNSLSKRFLRIKRGVDDNRWVLVDIEHKITLRDLQNVDL